MSVTVDYEKMAAEEMGLITVGQVLSHLQRSRIVVNLLIDGEQPDLSQISKIRQSLLKDRTLFIETVEPKQMAIDVLDEIALQLKEADAFKAEAADLLQQNLVAKAMEKLGMFFTAWQTAEEAITKIGQLLRVDLASLQVDGRPLPEMLTEFANQLRQIKDALQDRDFVLLTDILLYETSESNERWNAVLDGLRAKAE